MKIFQNRAEKILMKIAKLILKPAYDLYEKWLWIQIRNGPFPRHIGIIPDGNRRWARKMGLDPTEGHVHGYEKFKEVLKWIWELNIKYTTIFAMSTENCLYRDENERNNLFNLARKGFKELANMREIHDHKVRVNVIGRLDLLPADILEQAKKLEEITKNYNNFYLNIALCYGGRQEIIDAIKSIINDIINGNLSIDELNENTFSKYLYTENMPDPDLIIRTSGEERISNFLLWQLAYSELYFCDIYWPDFRKIDFWRALRSYQSRERRFGR
ncbi:MAG: polyprenyl diphosphate synthase [Desulfurococcaceae archaeon]